MLLRPLFVDVAWPCPVLPQVVYSKPPRRHREYFFRNIRKLRELQAEVERIN